MAQKKRMEDELRRQEEEKAEIEARLRERLAKQQEEEEKKLEPSVPMMVTAAD